MIQDSNKTVFLSYRYPISNHLAELVYRDLMNNDYDVFLHDLSVKTAISDLIVLNQIGARTHFVLLLSEGSLERCQDEDDKLRQEIQQALTLKRNIVFVIEEGCDLNREIAYLPKIWQDKFKLFNRVRLSHGFFNDVMGRFRKSYLSTPDFHIELYPLSEEEHHKVEQYQSQVADFISQSQNLVHDSNKPSSLDLMPQPFAWVNIPSGEVTLLDEEPYSLNYKYSYLREPTTFHVKAFQIAKYPITNAQFDVFIKHPEGYQNPHWWQFSINFKKWKKENQTPIKLQDTRDNIPRCHVTWYEAVAFCLWLSDMTGEKIMLPTEQQWQRAAQGDDGRKYPWGNDLDKHRCNYNHTSQNPLTSVTQYEGLGDSPFGVVDMAGNIWEWCVTESVRGWSDLTGSASRICRGGTIEHYDDNPCLPNTYRNVEPPYIRHFSLGFRIARLP